MKNFKIIVAGPRECTDKDLIYEAIDFGIKELGKPTMIVAGGCIGVDKMAIEYAKEHGFNYVEDYADWNNIKVQGAVIKERVNPWTKKKEKYNANAGFQRNERMASYSDALIAINIGNTPGTSNMIKIAKDFNLKVYIYEPKTLNTGDFLVEF